MLAATFQLHILPSLCIFALCGWLVLPCTLVMWLIYRHISYIELGIVAAAQMLLASSHGTIFTSLHSDFLPIP